MHAAVCAQFRQRRRSVRVNVCTANGDSPPTGNDDVSTARDTNSYDPAASDVRVTFTDKPCLYTLAACVCACKLSG